MKLYSGDLSPYSMFLIQNVLPTVGVEDPLPGCARMAAYWAAIQTNEHAARTLVELYRGLDERRALIRASQTPA